LSKIALAGAVSGTATFTIESPATSTNRTLTLPDNTGTIITQNSTPAFASTIGVGGATPSTSGAGITFPATQSASSDANTLDDYEEGTFDVAVAFGGASTGITYGQRNFSYVKIGNTVFISGYVVLSNKGSSTGNASITGLPFTSASGNASYSAFSLHIANTTFGGFPNMFISPGFAVLDIYECSDAGSVTAITNADFTNTSGLIISGFYRT